ncbi:MFS transporter [Streptomyces sp.]|uniref:MFS transporter n=1 Tax=Streptomyces sp. TaxID=1931 RepID=UPI0028118BC7|nr:MFS transporter [Streptomyces sp.]
MRSRRRLGRDFGLLWAGYAVSAYGSGLAFGALPLVAVLVLRAGPAEVALLSAAGPAVGALVALPLAPWVDRRRRRPVMIAADLVRCGALMSIPVAYACGLLGFGQVLAVSVVTAAARITFGAASGALVTSLVRPDDRLVAQARFESTNWSSLAVGPPLGGAAIGLFGPVATVVADAFGHLLSALAIGAMRGGREAGPGAAGQVRGGAGGLEPVAHAGRAPEAAGRVRRAVFPPAAGDRGRVGAVLCGWRHLLGDPGLRALFLNQLLVSGLVMATEPLLAVLLLRDLALPPWQYGLVFAVPCLGGLVGSRLAPRVVARHGRDRVLRTAGTLRVLWLPGLALAPAGVTGLVTVTAVELAIVLHMSLYTPVVAACRLERTPPHLVARTLTAWSLGQQASLAVCTTLGGLLAGLTGPRPALAAVGLLALATPLLLPRPGQLAPLTGEPAGGRR